MKLSDFDYFLPKELIAQYPLKERDQAKLLIVERKSGSIKHKAFKDILDFLHKSDLVVLNDTKVLKSRLFGKRLSSGKVEVFLLNRKSDSVFEAMIRPSRVKIGEKIIFNSGKIYCSRSAENEVTFNSKDMDEIYSLGNMPLPPYIKRPSGKLDDIYYQTVYAKEPGAVASPTAGLHFTNKLLLDIKSKGAKLGFISLHVGPGTFKPVKTFDITNHKMDKEYFVIKKQAQRLIESAKKTNKKILAVGTTSCRALEEYAEGKKEGYSDLFIYPGYKFKIVESLLTNFHLPKTTLFMLVCAFLGKELTHAAYKKAIEKKYRFYSYGDAMLII